VIPKFFQKCKGFPRPWGKRSEAARFFPGLGVPGTGEEGKNMLPGRLLQAGGSSEKEEANKGGKSRQVRKDSGKKKRELSNISIALAEKRKMKPGGRKEEKKFPSQEGLQWIIPTTNKKKRVLSKKGGEGATLAFFARKRYPPFLKEGKSPKRGNLTSPARRGAHPLKKKEGEKGEGLLNLREGSVGEFYSQLLTIIRFGKGRKSREGRGLH